MEGVPDAPEMPIAEPVHMDLTDPLPDPQEERVLPYPPQPAGDFIVPVTVGLLFFLAASQL